MTRIAVLFGLALIALAGCGADGDPVPPTQDAVSLLTGPEAPIGF